MKRFQSLELGLGIKGTTKTKHNNKRTVYNGVTYASKMEAKHAMWLDAECQLPTGLYTWWIGQPKFHLGCPENVYVADFLVVRNPMTNAVPEDVIEIHEVKGHRTAKFKHDLKLWKQYGPCKLRVYSRHGLYEQIELERKE